MLVKTNNGARKSYPVGVYGALVGRFGAQMRMSMHKPTNQRIVGSTEQPENTTNLIFFRGDDEEDQSFTYCRTSVIFPCYLSSINLLNLLAAALINFSTYSVHFESFSQARVDCCSTFPRHTNWTDQHAPSSTIQQYYHSLTPTDQLCNHRNNPHSFVRYTIDCGLLISLTLPPQVRWHRLTICR